MIYEDSYNPMLEFVDYPVFLEDIIYEAHKKNDIPDYYSYTEFDTKLNEYVRHVYAIRETKKDGWQCKEVRRDFETKPSIYRDLYYISYGCANGCHSIFTRTLRNYCCDCYEPSSKWMELNDYFYKRMPNYAQELNTIESIIANDMSLRYCGFKGQQIAMFNYIKLYRKHPIVETYMKLGLWRLVENEKAIKIGTENKFFRKWLYAHAEECKDRAFQHIYNAFKKNPNGSVEDYYNSLQYRIQCGLEVAGRDKRLYEKVLKYTTQEKLYNYLDDNNIGKNTYWDYIHAADWLQLDFNDTKVLFPKDFNTYHDLYTKQYADAEAEREAAKNKEKNKKMFKVAKKYQKYFEFENASFMVVIAKSKEELITEGTVLHHCVGRMNYDERMRNEESLICFLRNINNPSMPFVTIEYNLKSNKVAQRYAANNFTPEQDVLDFIDNEWLPHIKQEFKNVKVVQEHAI